MRVSRWERGWRGGGTLSHPFAPVFNYWEPLHYLAKGKGFQTWEYSPDYAIRSYFYLVFNSLPGWGSQLFLDKVSSSWESGRTTADLGVVTAPCILCPPPHLCHHLLPCRSHPLPRRRRPPQRPRRPLPPCLLPRLSSLLLRFDRVPPFHLCHVGSHARYGGRIGSRGRRMEEDHDGDAWVCCRSCRWMALCGAAGCAARP